jgi:hypothetical protein
MLLRSCCPLLLGLILFSAAEQTRNDAKQSRDNRCQVANFRAKFLKTSSFLKPIAMRFLDGFLGLETGYFLTSDLLG